jgi:hypothetical protein
MEDEIMEFGVKEDSKHGRYGTMIVYCLKVYFQQRPLEDWKKKRDPSFISHLSESRV